jgi:hypothetical protein
MHASLLNEDLMQPEKLEMGISHRTSGRTGHIDWGRHEITPGWSAIRKESRSLPADRYKSASRQEIKHSRDARLNEAARAADATREALGAVVASWLV